MRRKSFPLVCWITLAAYLLANTPCGVLGAAPLPGCPDARCPGCPHPHAHSPGAPDQDAEPSDPAGPGQPGSPDCPCCPDKPACPCPGGCAFCSVAKIPCLASFAPAAEAAPCIGDCLLEEAFLYVPPLRGHLIRPPRA